MANLEDLIMRDTRANQPAAGVPGRLYYVTDESVTERDNGSTWEDISDAGGSPDAADVTYTPTTATDWDGDADPGDLDNALDQLAERVDDLEGSGVAAAIYPQRAHTAMDPYNWDIKAGTPTMNITINTSQVNCYYCSTTGSGNGDAFETSVLLKAGTYDFVYIGVTATSRGILDWSMDGAAAFLSGDDWYAGSNGFNVVKTGTVVVAANGRHLLRATINGKNGSSSAYSIGITSVWLTIQSQTSET